MKELTEAIAITALIISEVDQDNTAPNFSTVLQHTKENQGAFETRVRIIELATRIEEAWDYLAANFDAGDFSELVMDNIGCYDFEFIPQLLQELYSGHDGSIVSFGKSRRVEYTMLQLLPAKEAWAIDRATNNMMTVQRH